MISKKLPISLFTAAAIFLSSQTKAQLFINSATFTIQPGATVTVQGDLTSNVDIQATGTGKVLLNGTASQTVSMSGFSIPNLEINKTGGSVTLATDVKISDSLVLTSGKITLGTNNLILTAAAATSAGSSSSFIETNSTGQAIKQLTGNVTSYSIPVGVGTSFRPAFVTTAGTYSSASVGVRSASAADPNRPPKISDYLLAYWPVTKTGITGTVNVAGQYLNSADISGTQANLKGYFFNGTDWSSATGTSTTGSNRVAANITTATGDVYGMDGFILLRAKAFLQGAYNTTTGVMSDALRAANLVPLSDPYRAAPYSTSFTHVLNSIPEATTSTVLGVQANTNNNIVDWVFLELRSSTVSPGNTVLQTRSALIQKDGDIVDIDGVSPVTFNNVPAGSYTIAVRHRNHLGISANPSTNLKALTEQLSVVTTLDFTTATAAQIYGTSSFGITTDSKNVLWAGNANSNANTKFLGLSNDKDFLLTALSNNSTTTLSAVYSQSDLNMNGNVKYLGLSNDKDFLLSTVLSNNSSAIKTQALPN